MKRQYINFSLWLIVRPFSGFQELKHEGKGSVRVALTIVAVLVFVVVINRQYAGFLVNYYDPQQMNSLNELRYVVIPVLLWSISNWSITTLMDGEGKFREIFMVTSYSTLPLIIIVLPFTFISNVMTLEETVFYWLFVIIALLWFFFLLFVGTMTVHQYSAAKTVGTMLLTVIVMLIIIFLTMLFFSLIQQIVDFIYNMYREIIFRR